MAVETLTLVALILNFVLMLVKLMLDWTRAGSGSTELRKVMEQLDNTQRTLIDHDRRMSEAAALMTKLSR